PFNVIKAKLFLGDVGSYFVGGWLAALAIVGLRAAIPPEAVLAPLAIYLADTSATLVRRARAGQVVYSPHREHAYQRLVRSGWSHQRTAAFTCVAVAMCSALGAVSLSGSTPLRIAADAAILAVVASYLCAPFLLDGHLGEPTVADA